MSELGLMTIGHLAPVQPSASSPAGVAKVQAMEAAMRATGRPSLALRVVHHFSEGVYIRELHMPAGTAIAGCLHKTRHLLQVVSGRIRIDNGDGAEWIDGPAMRETLPGTKRAIYAETDAILQTTHLNPSNTRDMGALFALIIEPEPTLPPPALENPA